ncbi:transposase [Dietzia sp. B19]|nr:transposase [Dietzia sp. B19]
MAQTKPKLRRFTDEQWERIESLLTSKQGRQGRPLRDNRIVVEAIVYRSRTRGATCLGSSLGCVKRYGYATLVTPSARLARPSRIEHQPTSQLGVALEDRLVRRTSAQSLRSCQSLSCRPVPTYYLYARHG